MEASSDGEEDAESTDKVTETVMNGGMKETLSLTVDAKTETAVFRRWPGVDRAAAAGGWEGGRGETSGSNIFNLIHMWAQMLAWIWNLWNLCRF